MLEHLQGHHQVEGSGLEARCAEIPREHPGSGLAEVFEARGGDLRGIDPPASAQRGLDEAPAPGPDLEQVSAPHPPLGLAEPLVVALLGVRGLEDRPVVVVRVAARSVEVARGPARDEPALAASEKLELRPGGERGETLGSAEATRGLHAAGLQVVPRQRRA